MKVDFIFHNNYDNYKRFKWTDAKPFDHIMLLITSGKISCSFGGGETISVGDKEIVYFPPGIRYSRRIEEPIGFHQFKFNVSDGGNALAHLRPGKLMIRHHRVEQIALDTGLAVSLPEAEKKSIFENLIGNIIYENYLFSANLEKKTVPDRDVLFAIQYFRDHDRTVTAFSHPAARVKDCYLYYALLDAVREIMNIEERQTILI